MYLAAILLCTPEACQFIMIQKPLTEIQCQTQLKLGQDMYRDKGFAIVDGKCIKWDMDT